MELFRFTETVSHIGIFHMLFMLLILWLSKSSTREAAGRAIATFAIIVALALQSATSSSTAIAEDQSDRGSGSVLNPERKAAVKRELLREGTLIPPTVGRIVMLGRRWAFIPADQSPTRNEDLVEFGRKTQSSFASYANKPRPTRLGTKTSLASTSSPSETEQLVREVANRGNHFQTALPQVLVVENLMLQRIAEAIRADGSDDRWTVSGEVTEYFNENQLLIRTAQRAAAN